MSHSACGHVSDPKKVVIIGAGGHAHAVCDVLLSDPSYQVIGLVDVHAQSGFWGLPLLGDDSILPRLLAEGQAEYVFVALGSNSLRKKLSLACLDMGYKLANAVSAAAHISPHAVLGEGVAIMPGAVIIAGARIGDGTIINTNASVDHDDIIGSYCHIAPGSTLCGYVSVGDGTFIGAGARVIDGISIGENSMIGAGAAVISSLPDECTAVGVPAKVLKQNNSCV